MNITVISHSCVVGSYQDKLALMAERYGDGITLITPPSWREGGRDVAAETRRYPAITVAPVPVRWPGHLNRHTYPLRILRKLFERSRPDVVYIEEEPRSLCALRVRRLCRAMNLPYVFFTWENIDRRFSFVHEWIMARVFRSAAGAVAGSWEASEILRRRSFDRPTLIQPQHGVDPSVFCRRPASRFREGWRTEGPVIGYAGRLVPEKGIDTLLSAFDRLTQPATCVIAGNGPEFGLLKQFAARTKRARDIYFLGSIPHEQMPELLSAFDILVLPSRTTPRWKEQFGRVLVEAMACGVCVVGSDSGAIPSVIGSAGWVFRENNVSTLTTILSDLVSDGGERRRLAEDGRTRVCGHFANEILAQKLHEFLSTVAAGNR